MRSLALALLLLIATPWAAFADEPSATKPGRPNVLMIAIDDLNDWCGPLGGHPQARTPHLDGLASQSVLFTRAYCAAPACNPSRAALMTGVSPSSSGVYHNNQPWRPALPDAVTLPQLFTKHGYEALGCGKIYHGRFPDPASWDEYESKGADPKPPNRPVNGIRPASHFDWGPVAATDAEMDDHRIIDWAIEQLNKPREKPLFLACGIYRPHLPWYVPTEYFERFPVAGLKLPEVPSDDLDDVPAAGVKMARPEGDHRQVLAAKQWPAAVQGYLASIAFADAQVGRLLEGLDRSPLADNTIVLLWSDHGWHLGEKQHWRKFALWEEACRVPLLVRLPGDKFRPGRCDEAVSLLDVYPTLADLCGLPLSAQLEGQSLRPLIGAPDSNRERPAVTTHGRNNHAVRDEKWRYIRYADGSEELYDHSRDPKEWRNLAGNREHDEIKRKLARWLPKKNVPDAKRGR